MWHLQYARARELAAEREREAQRVRLAHLHAAATQRPGSRSGGLRRAGAIAATWIARHLDEAAAHDALARRASEDSRVGLPG
jgi:hypothetical protein